MADATLRRLGPESVAGDDRDSVNKIESILMPPVSEMEKGTAEPKEDQSKKVPTTDDPGSLPATSLTQSTDVQSDGAGKTGESAQKNKEKEERLRLVREKQQEELKRRMEGLREATSRSEEFRKRLEEDRKRRVERLRQTEEEHRVIVENRRKRIIEEENERRLALIQRTMHRDVKLEQVKPKKNMATPPNALPAGTLSDGTISSGGRSPSRQRRPHSVAGRLPNYASPTVASQCRMARGLEKTFAGNLTVCYRCRSAPPDLRLKSSDSAASRPSRQTVKIGLEPASRSETVTEVNLINTQKSQLPSKLTSTPGKIISATVSTNSLTNKTKSAFLAKSPVPGKPVPPVSKVQAISGNADGTKSKGGTESHAKSSPTSKSGPFDGSKTKYIVDSQTKEVIMQKTSTTTSDAKQTNGFAVPQRGVSHALHKKEPTAVKDRPTIQEPVTLTAVALDQSTKATAGSEVKPEVRPIPSAVGPKDSKKPTDRTTLRLKKSPTDVKSAALGSPSRTSGNETSSRIPSSNSQAKDASPTKPSSAKTPTFAPSKKGTLTPQAKPLLKAPQTVQMKDYVGDGGHTAKPPVVPKEATDTHGARTRNGAKTKPGKESSAGKAKAAANGDVPKQVPGPVGEDEYKAKLTEKRRLARERAEIDAAQEKLLKEEALKKHKEEEEERRKKEEQRKLERQKEDEEKKLERQKEAEEKRQRLEETKRAHKKKDEERKQRRDERNQKEKRTDHEENEKNVEKDGSEVLARQSSTEKLLEKPDEKREEKIEMKLKEEMDSREKKRSEKTKREEEERIERKKRLDDIMKRVKPDESKVSSPLSPMTTVVRGLENLASPVSSLALQSMSETEENLESVDLSDINVLPEALPTVAIVEQTVISGATCTRKEEILTVPSVAQQSGGESSSGEPVELELTGAGNSERSASPEMTTLLKDLKAVETIVEDEKISGSVGQMAKGFEEIFGVGKDIGPAEGVERSTEKVTREMSNLEADTEAVGETSVSLVFCQDPIPLRELADLQLASTAHCLSQEPSQAEQPPSVESTEELGLEPRQAIIVEASLSESIIITQDHSQAEQSAIVELSPKASMLGQELSHSEQSAIVELSPTASMLNQDPSHTEESTIVELSPKASMLEPSHSEQSAIVELSPKASMLSQEVIHAEKPAIVELSPKSFMLGQDPSHTEQSAIVELSPKPSTLDEDPSQTGHPFTSTPEQHLASQLASDVLQLSQKLVDAEEPVIGGESTPSPLVLLTEERIHHAEQVSEPTVRLPLQQVPSPDEQRVTLESPTAKLKLDSKPSQREAPETFELVSTSVLLNQADQAVTLEAVTLEGLTSSLNNELASEEGEVTIKSAPVHLQEESSRVEQAVGVESKKSSKHDQEEMNQLHKSSESASALVQESPELDFADQVLDSAAGSLSDEKSGHVTMESTKTVTLFRQEPSQVKEHLTLESADFSPLGREYDQSELGLTVGSASLNNEKSDREKERERLEALLIYSSEQPSCVEQPMTLESAPSTLLLSDEPGQREWPVTSESTILTLSQEPNEEELRIASELVTNALLSSLQPALAEQGIVLTSTSEDLSISPQLSRLKEQLASKSTSRIDTLSQEPSQLEQGVTLGTVPSAFQSGQEQNTASVSHPGLSSSPETVQALSSVDDKFNLAEDFTMRLKTEEPGSPGQARSETSSVDITRSADSSITDSVRSEESSTADATRSEEPGWGDEEVPSGEDEEEDEGKARKRDEQFARLEVEADQAWVREMEASGQPPEVDEEETLREEGGRAYSVDDIGYPVKQFAGCDLARRKTQPAVYWGESKDHGHAPMKDASVIEELESTTNTLEEEGEQASDLQPAKTSGGSGLEGYEEQCGLNSAFYRVLERPEAKVVDILGQVEDDVRAADIGRDEMPLPDEAEVRIADAQRAEKVRSSDAEREEILRQEEEFVRVSDTEHEEIHKKGEVTLKDADRRHEEIPQHNKDEVRVTDTKHAEKVRSDDAKHEEILRQNEIKLQVTDTKHEEIPRQDEGKIPTVTGAQQEQTFGQEDKTSATTIRHEEIYLQDKIKVSSTNKEHEEILWQDEGKVGRAGEKREDRSWQDEDNLRQADEEHGEMSGQDKEKVRGIDERHEETSGCDDEPDVCRENVSPALEIDEPASSAEKSSSLNIHSDDGAMQPEVGQCRDDMATVFSSSSVSEIEPHTAKTLHGAAHSSSDKEVILSAEELLHRHDNMVEGPATTSSFNGGSAVQVPHAASFESTLPMRNSGVFFDLSKHDEREPGGTGGPITTTSDIHEGHQLASKTPATSQGSVETYGLQNISKEFFSELSDSSSSRMEMLKSMEDGGNGKDLTLGMHASDVCLGRDTAATGIRDLSEISNLASSVSISYDPEEIVDLGLDVPNQTEANQVVDYELGFGSVVDVHRPVDPYAEGVVRLSEEVREVEECCEAPQREESLKTNASDTDKENDEKHGQLSRLSRDEQEFRQGNRGSHVQEEKYDLLVEGVSQKEKHDHEALEEKSDQLVCLEKHKQEAQQEGHDSRVQEERCDQMVQEETQEQQKETSDREALEEKSDQLVRLEKHKQEVQQGNRGSLVQEERCDQLVQEETIEQEKEKPAHEALEEKSDQPVQQGKHDVEVHEERKHGQLVQEKREQEVQKEMVYFEVQEEKYDLLGLEQMHVIEVQKEESECEFQEEKQGQLVEQGQFCCNVPTEKHGKVVQLNKNKETVQLGRHELDLLVQQDEHNQVVQQGTNDRLHQHGTNDRLIQHGTNDQFVQEGQHDHVAQQRHDHVVPQGQHDYVVQQGQHDFVVQEGTLVHMVQQGTHDQVVHHDRYDQVVQQGTHDQVVHRDRHDQVVQQGAHDQLVQPGTYDHQMVLLDKSDQVVQQEKHDFEVQEEDEENGQHEQGKQGQDLSEETHDQLVHLEKHKHVVQHEELVHEFQEERHDQQETHDHTFQLTKHDNKFMQHKEKHDDRHDKHDQHIQQKELDLLVQQETYDQMVEKERCAQMDKHEEKHHQMVQQEKDDQMVQQAKDDQMVQQAKDDQMVQQAKDDQIVKQEKDDQMAQQEKYDPTVEKEKCAQMGKHEQKYDQIVQQEKDEMVRQDKDNQLVQQEKDDQVVQQAKDDQVSQQEVKPERYVHEVLPEEHCQLEKCVQKPQLEKHDEQLQQGKYSDDVRQEKQKQEVQQQKHDTEIQQDKQLQPIQREHGYKSEQEKHDHQAPQEKHDPKKHDPELAPEEPDGLAKLVSNEPAVQDNKMEQIDQQEKHGPDVQPEKHEKLKKCDEECQPKERGHEDQDEDEVELILPEKHDNEIGEKKFEEGDRSGECLIDIDQHESAVHIKEAGRAEQKEYDDDFEPETETEAINWKAYTEDVGQKIKVKDYKSDDINNINKQEKVAKDLKEDKDFYQEKFHFDVAQEESHGNAEYNVYGEETEGKIYHHDMMPQETVVDLLKEKNLDEDTKRESYFTNAEYVTSIRNTEHLACAEAVEQRQLLKDIKHEKSQEFAFVEDEDVRYAEEDAFLDNIAVKSFQGLSDEEQAGPEKEERLVRQEGNLLEHFSSVEHSASVEGAKNFESEKEAKYFKAVGEEMTSLVKQEGNLLEHSSSVEHSDSVEDAKNFESEKEAKFFKVVGEEMTNTKEKKYEKERQQEKHTKDAQEKKYDTEKCFTEIDKQKYGMDLKEEEGGQDTEEKYKEDIKEFKDVSERDAESTEENKYSMNIDKRTKDLKEEKCAKYLEKENCDKEVESSNDNGKGLLKNARKEEYAKDQKVAGDTKFHIDSKSFNHAGDVEGNNFVKTVDEQYHVQVNLNRGSKGDKFEENLKEKMYVELEKNLEEEGVEKSEEGMENHDRNAKGKRCVEDSPVRDSRYGRLREDQQIYTKDEEDNDELTEKDILESSEKYDTELQEKYDSESKDEGSSALTKKCDFNVEGETESSARMVQSSLSAKSSNVCYRESTEKFDQDSGEKFDHESAEKSDHESAEKSDQTSTEKYDQESTEKYDRRVTTENYDMGSMGSYHKESMEKCGYDTSTKVSIGKFKQHYDQDEESDEEIEEECSEEQETSFDPRLNEDYDVIPGKKSESRCKLDEELNEKYYMNLIGKNGTDQLEIEVTNDADGRCGDVDEEKEGIAMLDTRNSKGNVHDSEGLKLTRKELFGNDMQDSEEATVDSKTAVEVAVMEGTSGSGACESISDEAQKSYVQKLEDIMARHSRRAGAQRVDFVRGDGRKSSDDVPCDDDDKMSEDYSEKNSDSVSNDSRTSIVTEDVRMLGDVAVDVQNKGYITADDTLTSGIVVAKDFQKTDEAETDHFDIMEEGITEDPHKIKDETVVEDFQMMEEVRPPIEDFQQMKDRIMAEHSKEMKIPVIEHCQKSKEAEAGDFQKMKEHVIEDYQKSKNVLATDSEKGEVVGEDSHKTKEPMIVCHQDPMEVATTEASEIVKESAFEPLQKSKNIVAEDTQKTKELGIERQQITKEIISEDDSQVINESVTQLLQKSMEVEDAQKTKDHEKEHHQKTLELVVADSQKTVEGVTQDSQKTKEHEYEHQQRSMKVVAEHSQKTKEPVIEPFQKPMAVVVGDSQEAKDHENEHHQKSMEVAAGGSQKTKEPVEVVPEASQMMKEPVIELHRMCLDVVTEDSSQAMQSVVGHDQKHREASDEEKTKEPVIEHQLDPVVVVTEESAKSQECEVATADLRMSQEFALEVSEKSQTTSSEQVEKYTEKCTVDASLQKETTKVSPALNASETKNQSDHYDSTPTEVTEIGTGIKNSKEVGDLLLADSAGNISLPPTADISREESTTSLADTLQSEVSPDDKNSEIFEGEETVEIYEEIEIRQETLVTRNHSRNLSVTLENVITEEKLEITYTSPDEKPETFLGSFGDIEKTGGVPTRSEAGFSQDVVDVSLDGSSLNKAAAEQQGKVERLKSGNVSDDESCSVARDASTSGYHCGTDLEMKAQDSKPDVHGAADVVETVRHTVELTQKQCKDNDNFKDNKDPVEFQGTRCQDMPVSQQNIKVVSDFRMEAESLQPLGFNDTKIDKDRLSESLQSDCKQAGGGIALSDVEPRIVCSIQKGMQEFPLKSTEKECMVSEDGGSPNKRSEVKEHGLSKPEYMKVSEIMDLQTAKSDADVGILPRDERRSDVSGVVPNKVVKFQTTVEDFEQSKCLDKLQLVHTSEAIEQEMTEQAGKDHDPSCGKSMESPLGKSTKLEERKNVECIKSLPAALSFTVHHDEVGTEQLFDHGAMKSTRIEKKDEDIAISKVLQSSEDLGCFAYQGHRKEKLVFEDSKSDEAVKAMDESGARSSRHRTSSRQSDDAYEILSLDSVGTGVLSLKETRCIGSFQAEKPPNIPLTAFSAENLSQPADIFHSTLHESSHHERESRTKVSSTSETSRDEYEIDSRRSESSKPSRQEFVPVYAISGNESYQWSGGQPTVGRVKDAHGKDLENLDAGATFRSLGFFAGSEKASDSASAKSFDVFQSSGERPRCDSGAGTTKTSTDDAVASEGGGGALSSSEQLRLSKDVDKSPTYRSE